MSLNLLRSQVSKPRPLLRLNLLPRACYRGLQSHSNTTKGGDKFFVPPNDWEPPIITTTETKKTTTRWNESDATLSEAAVKADQNKDTVMKQQGQKKKKDLEEFESNREPDLDEM